LWPERHSDLASRTGRKPLLDPGPMRGWLNTIWCWLRRPDTVLWVLLASLLILPVVMFNSLSGASVAQMKLQADEISTLATGIRSYYADNVIARLQAADGQAVYSENYRNVHGGIPIPATLSIELGALFDNAHNDGRISYEFLSDYPFAKRVSHPLDTFERDALQAFRTDPERKLYTQLSGNGIGRSSYRLATPVLMRSACVRCHNSHPDSPKRDWKVGDVRGIQEVTVRGIQGNGLSNISFLMGYVGLLGITSVAATGVFQRQSQQLARVNQKLLDSSQRESTLATRLADQLQELSIFGSVVDDSIIGISIADMRKHDEPLIYVNNAFTTITGYPRDLAIGYNCRFLQGPDTDPRELEEIRKAIRTGKSYSGELVNYRQDGTRFWNRLTLYPIFTGDSGTPEYYVANQVDVTSLKTQAGIPLSDLQELEQEIVATRQALGEAERFGLALRERLQPPDQDEAATATESEAFLLAEQMAHGKLRAIIERVLGVISRHTGSH
jgi:PAS domain S-box-containing protein